MKTQNGRCAFLQAGMDQNGLGDRNRLGERAAKEPSKEKTKLANLTRAGKGLDQISKPLPVTHRTDQEKERKSGSTSVLRTNGQSTGVQTNQPEDLSHGELLAAKRNARDEYCRWQEQPGLRLREKEKLIARFSQEQIRLQTMN
jgi:hypothetical protein